MTNPQNNWKRPKAVIMAGGTGGHIFPGLAVAEKLLENEWQISWLGSAGGMEEKIVADNGIEFNAINVQGIRGKGIVGWIKAPFRLIRSVWEAKEILKNVSPNVVIGFGGFASGPGGLASVLSGITLCIHEQNAVAGMTNKALSMLASKVFQTFPTAFEESKKVATVGNPIRQEIVNLRNMKRTNETEQVNILVIGGSRGAIALNQALPEVFAKMKPENLINVKHQVGSGRLEESLKYYEKAFGMVTSELLSNGINIVEFIDNMASAFEWADIVICRAGASTVCEISAASKCAIFVPFPYAVDDHQTKNANWLVSQNAGFLYKESELVEETFFNNLTALINDKEKINQVAEKAGSLAKLEAAKEIAKFCNSLRLKAA